MLIEPDKDRSIWVEFDNSYKSRTPKDVYLAFDQIFHPPGESAESAGMGAHWAEVVAVGKFEVARRFKKTTKAFGDGGFGHLGKYPYQLTVKYLEQAKPAP